MGFRRLNLLSNETCDFSRGGDVMIKYSRIICLLLFVAFFAMSVGCKQGNLSTDAISESNPEQTLSGHDFEEMRIIVNDMLLENEVIANVSSKCVVIPVMGCFEALGAKIEWYTDTEADLVFENENYTLDIDTMTLSKSDDPYSNYLFGIYGSEYVFFAQGKEVFMDSITFTTFLERFGINIDIDVDEEECVVTINQS